MILSAVPIWMNEVVPPKNRGAFVDLHGASLLFGYALSAWVGLGFYHLHAPGNNVWRAPMGTSPPNLASQSIPLTKSAIQCLPALLTTILAYVLPESPRWLLMNDRYDQARNNLLKMHSPEEAAVELAQINAQMQIDRHLPNSYWAMFKRPSYRKRSLLAIATTGGIQFSGILVINSMYTSCASSPAIYSYANPWNFQTMHRRSMARWATVYSFLAPSSQNLGKN